MPRPNSADDAKLDDALEGTFPASDPLANTVGNGIRIGPLDRAHEVDVSDVTDNRGLHRFETTIDGQTAFLSYERGRQSMALIHTEVPPPLRGRHLGDRLVEAALAVARSNHLNVVAVCPFARAYMRRRHL